MTNVNETIVVDHDPVPDSHRRRKVTMQIEVPPKAVSAGWGDMSWIKKRKQRR